MAIEVIDTTTGAGDSAKAGGDKINRMFAELYADPGATLRAVGNKILAAANGYTTRSYMTTAPSVVVSTVSANTTIPTGTATDGAPMYLLNNALLYKTGPVRQLTSGNNLNGFVGAWASLDALFDGGSGWCVALRTDSRYVEFNVSRNGKVDTMQLRVNGQWAKLTDYILFSSASDFSRYQVRVDFGSVAFRNIEAFWPNLAAIVGVNVTPGATVTLPETSPGDVAAAMWGDSYVAGGTPGQPGVRNTLCQLVAEQLGIRDIVPMGRGGQGWATNVDGRNIAQRIALDANRISSRDLIFAYGSLNDSSASASTAQANITAGIQSLQAAHPSAWIIFLSGFSAVNGVNDPAHYAAYLAGAKAAADIRTIIIDTSFLPLVTSVGVLPNGLPNDSPDGTHPGLNWTTFATAALRNAVITSLSTRVLR